MTIYEIELPWWHSGPPLSMNKRMHWRAAWQLKQQIESDVITMARHHKLPKGCRFADITMVWLPSTTRRRDSDNPAPTLKAAVDACVKYGLVADDTPEYVTSKTVIGPVRAGAHEVTLRIEVR